MTLEALAIIETTLYKLDRELARERSYLAEEEKTNAPSEAGVSLFAANLKRAFSEAVLKTRQNFLLPSRRA